MSLDRLNSCYIILEAKEHLQTLVEWKFRKVRIECNKVAYELVNLARRNVHTATAQSALRG